MAVYENSSKTAAAARDEDGAALLRSGARTAKTLIENGTVGLFHPAAPTNNHGAPYASPGVLARNENNGTAYLVDLRALPRALGFADAGRGEMLPYPTQTTGAAFEPAAAYYNSGAVAGVAPALPLSSQVFADKTMSIPNVARMLTERLRRGIPVFGLSVASLATAELAAGEPTPAAAFGLLLILIVGLSAVTIRGVRA
ncbi:unnamed protein product [Urochloa humidicola]